jgi:hypothetical protein
VHTLLGEPSLVHALLGEPSLVHTLLGEPSLVHALLKEELISDSKNHLQMSAKLRTVFQPPNNPPRAFDYQALS